MQAFGSWLKDEEEIPPPSNSASAGNGNGTIVFDAIRLEDSGWFQGRRMRWTVHKIAPDMFYQSRRLRYGSKGWQIQLLVYVVNDLRDGWTCNKYVNIKS